MKLVNVNKAELGLLQAYRNSPSPLKGVFKTMVQVAQSGDGLARLPKVLARAANAIPGPKISPAGTIERIEGFNAVKGQITVNGEKVHTFLWEGTLNKHRVFQQQDARWFDKRIATRKENLAYVDSLLAKKDSGTINDAEKIALKRYRYGFVRDTEGGLCIDGDEVSGGFEHWDYAPDPRISALFVRVPRRRVQ